RPHRPERTGAAPLISGAAPEDDGKVRVYSGARIARHERMFDARIARAPISASRSITALWPLRGTIARTATEFSFASGEIVGDSRPGVTSTACSSRCFGQS